MSHYIAGEWVRGEGPELASVDPAAEAVCWEGRAASANEVDRAIRAAREAWPQWAEQPVEAREGYLRAFADELDRRREELAETLAVETGKPKWDAHSEVGAMIQKVPTTVEAYHERRSSKAIDLGGTTGVTRHKPLGVLLVFGPANLPGHLPNGHIVPALLAGNTGVFKPSEQTPAVAEKLIELWEAAGLPPGVLNMVHGARQTGVAAVMHGGHDGVLFTGGVQGGLALRRALANQPQRILALEMGGNNPLVVHGVADRQAAASLAVLSAYMTSGQRCTCARRLIVPEGGEGDALVETLAEQVRRIRVGPYHATPEPFMGPLLSRQAADAMLEAQETLTRRGSEPVVRMERLEGSAAMVSAGLLDVTAVADREDKEHFGPLLQLIRVPDTDAAIEEANNTEYGLAAGLLSDDPDLYDRFDRRIRAGLVNWNRQTTGASGRLPFGGIGLSGNHRPSGAFAVDYCTYAVASLERRRAESPQKLPPGLG